jgi:hypothetical protein
VNDDAPEKIVERLLPLLRRFCVGDYGIALGGSYAKGTGDAQSDVDIYLFAHRVLPGCERSAIIEQAPLELGPVHTWGEDGDDWREGGTDFWVAGRKVECWLRNAGRVDATLQASVEGRIARDCVVWTVMGFYSYVLLSDLRVMRIIEDPCGILAGWKARIAEYPAALREAILAQYLAEARFWPDNFHYKTAVERGDILYTSGIVQQVVYALIQVVYALNRVYFPGEKMVAATLAKLPIQPADFAGRIRALVYPGDAGTVADLRAQQGALAALVGEVAQLVRRDAGQGCAYL